jgi:hypothetical protein
VTVSVYWAHLITRLALIAMVGIHLGTRRRPPLHRTQAGRRLAYALFLVAAAAMAVTGLLRLAGVAPHDIWHGGIGYLVLVHLWSVRRTLRARMRARSKARREDNARGARYE